MKWKLALGFFSLVLIAGGLGAGTTTADAHGCNCGPKQHGYTSYRYHTTNRVSHVTHFHDFTHTNYYHVTHRVVDVTLVRPIVYVHNVNRIHERSVAVWHQVHAAETRVLPARVYSSTSTVHVGCGCGGGYGY